MDGTVEVLVVCKGCGLVYQESRRPDRCRVCGTPMGSASVVPPVVLAVVVAKTEAP